MYAHIPANVKSSAAQTSPTKVRLGGWPGSAVQACCARAQVHYAQPKHGIACPGLALTTIPCAPEASTSLVMCDYPTNQRGSSETPAHAERHLIGFQ